MQTLKDTLKNCTNFEKGTNALGQEENLNRTRLYNELLQRCKPLSEYMELINRIRDNQEHGMDINTAINMAVDSCIRDGIMSEFLIKHKAKVISVCLTEFDEKVFVKGIREEGYEEGMIAGEAKGEVKGEAKGLKEGIFDLLEDYGEISENLGNEIMKQTELEASRKWLKIAARVETIEEFEEKTGLIVKC